jgi:hypothetical protein
MSSRQQRLSITADCVCARPPLPHSKSTCYSNLQIFTASYPQSQQTICSRQKGICERPNHGDRRLNSGTFGCSVQSCHLPRLCQGTVSGSGCVAVIDNEMGSLIEMQPATDDNDSIIRTPSLHYSGSSKFTLPAPPVCQCFAETPIQIAGG